MNIAGKTDIGAVRSSNQDCFAIRAIGENCSYAVVCDGMGGAKGGEVASRMAVDIISKALDEGLRQNMSEKSVRLVFETAIFNANLSIFTKACEDANLKGMGTTAVVTYVNGDMVYIAHVGDSRIYLVNSTCMRQLTRDHSIVQAMIENGQITPEEALNHPHKNIITRALGAQEATTVDFNVFEKQDSDILLLCTDGLTNYVGEEKIAGIIRNNEFDNLPDLLIKAAIDGGGGDNITAAVIK